LALIKIDAKGLKPVHLASIDNVKVGELVIAVGNPLGLNSTVTTGIVSAIGRGQLNLLSSRDRYSVENFIQTDAAINPGNSGGGLFNLQGSLIGINTAIASRTGTYIGYGFAIPVDLVKAVVSDLIENGTINRGVIGIEIRSIDEVEAKAVGLDAVEGIFVQKVLPDSPAEKAGVESGDVIIELDGKKVRTSNELQSMLVFHHAGDEVKLTIWRDNNRINKTLKLKSIDNITAKNEEVASKGDEERENFKADKKVEFEKLGFSVEPLNNEQKEKYDVKNGVVISNVKRYSVAYDRGLVAQGIITKADRKSVNSPKDLEKIIDSKKPGEAIMLQVNYKDNLRMVALEIPKK